MKASEYSYCANADLSEDGSLIVHGVPKDADTWCTDEKGAVQIRVESTGDCKQISGPTLDWDDLSGIDWEIDRHFPGVKGRFV